MTSKHAPRLSPARRVGRAARTGGTALALATPWVCALAALGLGAGGVATQSLALAGAGALAGTVGTTTAQLRARSGAARAAEERSRLRTEQRRLLLLVATLRARAMPDQPEQPEQPEALPDGLVIPDVVPDVMPAQRPTGAPAISMELPVLSSRDEPVARGTLAAVIELRAVPRPTDTATPLPIGELERRVYAAIAAQDPLPAAAAADAV